MKHEINLSKYEARTDLISDYLQGNQNESFINLREKTYKDIKIEEVIVDRKCSRRINKKMGRYVTISFPDVTDQENRSNVLKVLTNELALFLKYLRVSSKKKCLVIGLGNDLSTPDCLGPKVIKDVIVTRHLFELGEVGDGYRNVSAFAPGVFAVTGIESQEAIAGIVEKVKPDFMIVIDALASLSIERVNKTIQMTDSGICPGAGIGNLRKEISRESMGIPVLAIGVPTVVDAVTIVSDTIHYLFQKINYNIKNMDKEVDKLKSSLAINYLTEQSSMSKEEKVKFLGLLGDLSDDEIKELIFEVLTPIGYNLMVTPKEIDFVIDKLAFVISQSINKSLHVALFDKN